MKLEKRLNNHDIQSTGEVTAMKLSENAQSTVFEIFTSGLYSDPIGSVIREITSNCFDSHIEAGKDNPKNPVLVNLTKEVSGNFISFIDNGVGMSPDRVHNIYGTYFESTKNETNDQIGGFGLGGKTPLAYTDSFFVITRKDKIQYTYNVFMGNDSPMIELMSQESTKEGNGTEVKIPVKENDIMEFEKKTLRQLFYFENIVFQGFSDSYVENEYNIVKAKTFLYREENYSKNVHICIGKVDYPINFEALGISEYDYQMPIAVQVEIGEIDVTRSREELKYTDRTKKILKKKLEAVRAELMEMLSAQYDNVQTIQEYYAVISSLGYLNFDEDRRIYIQDVKAHDVVFPNFIYNDLKMPKYDELISTFYDTKRFGKKERRHYSQYHSTFQSMNDYSSIVYYVNDKFKRVVLKQSYLQYENDRFYIHTPKELTDIKLEILKKDFGLVTTKEIPLTKKEIAAKEKAKKKAEDAGEYYMDTDGMFRHKTVNVIPKAKAEKLIKDLASTVHKIMVAKANDYDALVVPDEYVKIRKENRMSASVLKTGISLKDMSGYGYRRKMTMKELTDFNGKIYYGFQVDEYTIRESANVFSEISGSDKFFRCRKWNEDYKGTMFVQVAKGNEKYLKMLGKKAVHVDYFYQTYVARKIDTILENKAKAKVETMYTDNVLEVFHNEGVFDRIDKDIFDVAKKVNDSLDSHTSYHYVKADKVLSKLKIDLDNVQVEFKFKKELEWLTNISVGCKDRLKWINFPYEVNPEDVQHKELIEMVNLCIDK